MLCCKFEREWCSMWINEFNTKQCSFLTINNYFFLPLRWQTCICKHFKRCISLNWFEVFVNSAFSDLCRQTLFVYYLLLLCYLHAGNFVHYRRYIKHFFFYIYSGDDSEAPFSLSRIKISTWYYSETIILRTNINF